MTTTVLPFELDHDEIRGHHVPAREIRGTVRLEGESIVIDYRLERSTEVGITHSVSVPLAAVTKLAMTGGVFKSPRLLLEVKTEELLKQLPWADGCMCVMRFKHAHGVALRQLIEEAEVRLAQIRGREGS